VVKSRAEQLFFGGCLRPLMLRASDLLGSAPASQGDEVGFASREVPEPF